MSRKRVVVYGWSHRVHVQRWVRGMASRGFDMRVISLDGDHLDDIETVVLPRTGRESYLAHIPKVKQLTRRVAPDLVHAHYAAGFGMWAWLVGVHPTLVSVWGADLIDFPSNSMKRWLIRRVLRSADGISATSNLLRKHVVSLAADCDQKTTVIPFGVELPDETTTPPDTPIRFCFIKAHRPKYGPDILLRAFRTVVDKLPEARLVIAGEGEMTAQLQQLSKELAVAEHVDFVGFVPNDQIFDFLARHHIMVMPSVMESESFGVAVLEASAAARPTIASRIGGVPEVLVHDHNGLLVPPNDVEQLAAAMLDLAHDRERCRRLGEQGRKLVQQRYTWTRSLDLMSELYDRLIHEHKKSR